MAEQGQVSVRGTPVHLLTGGAGPALLFLHSAGAGRRWLDFQEQLSRRFTVYAPAHPGHTGTPAADWIEHITDLALRPWSGPPGTASRT